VSKDQQEIKKNYMYLNNFYKVLLGQNYTFSLHTGHLNPILAWQVISAKDLSVF
jgi:hypothetical protein